MSEQSREDLKRTPRRKQELRDSTGIDRIPPHSLESERGLIGSLLVNAVDTLPVILSLLGATGEQFYDLRNQKVYQRICELVDDNVPVDLTTVTERLKTFNELEEIGGYSNLSELSNAAAGVANAEAYANTIRDNWLLRRLINVSTDTAANAYNRGELSVGEIIDDAERELMLIGQQQTTRETPPIMRLVQTAISRMESYQQGKVTGLETGFPDLDRMTNGLQNGDMIVIAGRPSMGKTSLAMNIVENVAVVNRIPTGVISMEMMGDALTERMIYSRARVNIRNAKGGFLAERDYPKITAAAGRIANAPIYIDDRSALSIMQIRAKARRWVQQYKIKLLVLDYLQLSNNVGTRKKYESRQQEISDISGGVKDIAKELQIPVIVLSQLNRTIEKEKNRLPRLSDLRESGSIEQDADIVGILYRPGNNDSDEEDPSRFDEVSQVNLLICKQRNGDTGPVPFTFMRTYTRFESMAREQGAGIPDRQEEFSTT
jgi:replicative DNA helicase